MSLLATILDELPAFIYWINNKMQLQGCNTRFMRLFKLDEDEIKSHMLLEKLSSHSPSIISQWVANNATALSQINPSSSYVEKFPTVYGDPFICKSYKLPIIEKEAIVGVINISFDITNQLKKEQETTFFANNLDMALNTLLACLPGHVYWQNKEGVILGCNKRQAISLGYNSARELKGKNIEQLVPKKQADELRKTLDEVVATGETINLEETVTFKQGKIELLSYKVPLKDKHGDIHGLLGSSIDITKQKKLERKLIAEKDKVKKSDKLKADFISNMEHDVRTPIAGVYGMMQILTDQEQNKEKKSFLHEVTLCAKELMDFCNDIVDFSKIQSGILSVSAKSFKLKELVDSVIVLESMAAKKQGIKLTLNFDESLPVIVIGDPYRLKRILVNLVSNAIKFTKIGFCRVSVAIATPLNSECTIIIRFTVADSGLGISDEKKSIIYEKFTKAMLSNTGLYKGLGLGLRIVKQFVDELESEIHLKSQVGKGSTFVVLIPFKVPLADKIIIDE